ncbi:hypothetical protein OO013_08655 [Mangrovivirga sp. M17]|uniref:Carbohydrate-binding family V/XII n=1 Tax=Mangrovivirga halotolerans TaxID=2993936 RepID=A0ABT3RRC3_9BACT|nr:hypothetical protein [Mangrovivirga halotolerans]MCX2743934.1 hypothetical protein [Mangrovivirga halotolerans]
MKKIILFYVLIFYQISINGQNNWPQIINTQSGASITIYQPHPEELNGNKLKVRSAISVKKGKDEDPVFGAIWANVMMTVDRDSRTASLESIDITDVRFPEDLTREESESLKYLIEETAPTWDLVIYIDEIIATIEKDQEMIKPDYNNSPPEIIYVDHESILVLIDGEPIYDKQKDFNIDIITNTPFLIFKDLDNNQLYLYGERFWFTSTSLNGEWKELSTLPKKIASIDKEIKKQENQNDEKVKVFNTTPKIIVKTNPAELISSDGPASFSNIQGTNLLYMDNSGDNVFMNIVDQNYYTVLSGRWYRSKKLDGNWEFIESDALPKDFSAIPEGSEKDNVLANIAGTVAAEEALLDAQIPQTAKVDRKEATCTIEYDGKPKFEQIKGTSLSFAVNTSATVIRDNKGFYAVENGVWFFSNDPEGPWAVATDRPEEVENIPPDNPTYNVKYVNIYDITPDYVYMGYTPGYVGCYRYGPTIIYGTGYHYNPWYGSIYYPRPVTWGFGMHYNPWSGWSMSFGFSVGWFNFSWGGSYYRPGGWWGPPAYRPHYWHRPPGGIYLNNKIVINNNYYGNHNNIYNGRPGVSTSNRPRPGNPDRLAPATRPSTGNRDRNRMDNTRPSKDRNTSTKPSTREQPSRNSREATRPGSKQTNNNIYSDRNGNVYKNTRESGWQQRSGNSWSKPSNTNNLNRMQYQRNRGNTRVNNAQRNMPQRSRPQPKTGGTGRRGGGR